MTRFVSERSYDYCELGEDSDEERAESSEDEIDIILRGTPDQRRRLHHHNQKQQQTSTGSKHSTLKHGQMGASSSEDEFEKEMNAELSKTVHLLEQARGKNKHGAEKGTGTTTSSIGKSESATFYDDVYFDSDDDENFEGGEDARRQRHHERPSNEDLFYDPDMDDEDQRWVDRHRQHQHGQGDMKGRKQSAGKKKGASSTDAVLDCPACMTTLCFDCQRHDIYPNQFRAMFVMNCKVDTTELLHIPEQSPKKKSKKMKRSVADKGGGEETPGSSGSAAAPDSKDKFHPVKCDECDTVVGVIDLDEVYHFFNVLTSQP